MIVGTHIVGKFYMLQHSLFRSRLLILPLSHQRVSAVSSAGTEGWRSQIASAEQADSAKLPSA